MIWSYSECFIVVELTLINSANFISCTLKNSLVYRGLDNTNSVIHFCILYCLLIAHCSRMSGCK